MIRVESYGGSFDILSKRRRCYKRYRFKLNPSSRAWRPCVRRFSDFFLPYMLTRNVRIQEDMVDQLLNSSEQRLARTLLLLAHYGKEGAPETIVPEINQETLAGMVGTTRSRVSFFMNKFKKMGFIDYKEGWRVHRSLLNIVLHD
jgi:CRP/FNR family cyclic AMP-dependent transcriptional regulator